MKRGNIFIPKSELDSMLDRAAAIKAEMTDLLRQLETMATSEANAEVGKWRQDPLGWMKPHQRKSK